MKKINIIQCTPYFPPHIGGLEKVVQDIDLHWKYGNSIILSGDDIQEEFLDAQKIFFPSYEIIPNFPVPMFWKKSFWTSMKLLKKTISLDSEYIMITHTRFFLSSLIGGLLAKRYKLKWIHIEHGSDYVKLSSLLKNKIAYIYDKTLGKCVLKKADRVLAISKTSKAFIRKEFGRSDIDVWYRGVDFPILIPSEELKNKFPDKIIIGYLGRLYQWKNVESLIHAYYKLDMKLFQLVIIGDGEDYERLRKIDKKNKVFFTGGVDAEKAYSYQKQFDIHTHPSSPGGGLATTLLQAMNLGCFIVATPYEGANEIITDGENGILLKDDSIEELVKGINKAKKVLDIHGNIYLEKNKKFIKNECDIEKNIKILYDYIA